MSDAEIKEAVRARDGYKCRICGMTNSAHVKACGRSLDVHRVLPGMNYQYCHYSITVCRKCHGPLPKNLDDAFWTYNGKRKNDDILFFMLNRYDPEEKAIRDHIEAEAERTGRGPQEVIMEILADHFGESPLYYSI